MKSELFFSAGERCQQASQLNFSIIYGQDRLRSGKQELRQLVYSALQRSWWGDLVVSSSSVGAVRVDTATFISGEATGPITAQEIPAERNENKFHHENGQILKCIRVVVGSPSLEILKNQLPKAQAQQNRIE